MMVVVGAVTMMTVELVFGFVYRGNDSSSFEHVFVGEGRGSEMIGLHNWIQFYLQEKAGNINYHGYFRRQTVSNPFIV